MFKGIIITFCLYLSCGLPVSCSAQSFQSVTDIYFVRHAETMGNVTHHHSHKNDTTLSSRGHSQVAALTRKLDRLTFDHIIVSPKQRALKTIMPFLKKHRLVAEIWPELEECCWQKHRDRFGGEPQRGSAIRIKTEMRPYFTFPDPDSHFRLNTRGYGQGMMQIFMATRKIKQRFSGTGQRILIVGHYHAGSRIMEILQGIEPTGRYHIANTQIHHLQENSDGTYTLLQRL